jgi:hypothetical protein
VGDEIIYETRAALSAFEAVWNSVLFLGRKVQVTTATIDVRGRRAIPFSSVTGCEYRVFLLLFFPHVRLEYLGEDSSPRVLRFWSPRLTIIQSEYVFARRLCDAIVAAWERYRQR